MVARHWMAADLSAALLIVAAVVLALMAEPVRAICPVCTVAVGMGVGLSRWLGVDDAISGLWIGGLVVSFIGWSLTELRVHRIEFRGQTAVVTIAWYVVSLGPLLWGDLIGDSLNTLWGVDRLLLGIAMGSLAFWAGARAYQAIKARNGDRAQFPFQKVVMPITPLVVLSLAFYVFLK